MRLLERFVHRRAVNASPQSTIGGVELCRLFNPGGIMIPVIGPTGTGKSTFINTILEVEHSRAEEKCQGLLDVGRGLRSCTREITPVKIKSLDDPRILYPEVIKDRTVMVVDTPGFDDSCTEDVQVLQRIATWLKKSYDERKTVAGVIYLHDISQDRFTGSVRKNLELFRRLCGKEAFSQVVIVMTKEEKLHPQLASKYEYELRSEHWRDLIDAGATVLSFKRNYRSARSIIDHVLRGLTRTFILQLQKEIAIQKKLLPATEAGKHLKTTLQQVLLLQSTILDMTSAMASTEVDSAGEVEKRLRELRDQMKILSEQISTLQELKTPHPNRFFRFIRKHFIFK